MPTDEQLIDGWRAGYILNITPKDMSCNDGSSLEDIAKDAPRNETSDDNSGEVIGTIAYNPNTSELEVDIYKK